MKKVLSYLGVLFGVLVLLQSCEKAEDPMQQINWSITMSQKNQAVWLEWAIDRDIDLKKVEISYNNTLIAIPANENSKLIEGLTNGTEYTFSLVAVNKSGKKSSPMTVKATPDQYIETVQGREIASGTYITNSAALPLEVTLNNNAYKMTMTAGSNSYNWEGNVRRQNDTTYRFNLEYYTIDYRGKTHVANIIQDISAVMCYSFKDSTYYVETAYEKIEGNKNFLPGKYRRYVKASSTDYASYNDTTYYYADISDNGTISYYDSSTANPTVSTWTNEDLLKENFLFINLDSRTYMINKNHDRLFKKQ